ncbi:hypothetical protein EVAR_84423_1 [Eumeta japonica]|uniref:Uncharacterized protein n=1 Tax=Eumeta variegata TaxID=151549 RepID=A0A4C1W302_EUMVA|nr:hypothetical protein EVAR_84423_1 [Eumeta japonica]
MCACVRAYLYVEAVTRWLRLGFRSGGIRFDLDYDRIDHGLFNVSQRKPRASCLRKHAKLPVADDVTAAVTTVFDGPRSALNQLKLFNLS